LWSKSTAKFAEAEQRHLSLYIDYDLNMPSSVGSVSDVDVPPLTVIGIREMGQTRLEKLYKPRLIEAINACMAYIDLLKS
jgi:hypothetical protein